MSYYKFIGTKKQAKGYPTSKKPKYGKIYKWDSHKFTTGIVQVVDWAEYYPNEWQETRESNYLIQKMTKKLKTPNMRAQLCVARMEQELQKLKELI